MELVTLKGMAISQFGSCTNFARAMEWNRSKAARILNGEQDPTLKDIDRIVKKMEIPQEYVVPIFFGTMFTK